MSSEQRNSTTLKDAQLKDLLLERAELEFVQIIIIIVVITVMVIVIICLLNHYKLSTRSFINRQSQNRRQEETLQPACLCYLDGGKAPKAMGSKCQSKRRAKLPLTSSRLELYSKRLTLRVCLDHISLSPEGCKLGIPKLLMKWGQKGAAVFMRMKHGIFKSLLH
nr:low-density lipoprotein receptor class A domain-containing protein 4 isoform X2 [Pelodiscus sinensis]XP_025037668.1 low-density lipoprotein receptor class A domain-containing protein 4 isoform X2 [Pelodiscus sinensis]|eukprot:XP_025037667.1 low-density lipoprotein receptor class A domain-containing protein 4 isoform X2 [Pelodiscus sinensis]